MKKDNQCCHELPLGCRSPVSPFRKGHIGAVSWKDHGRWDV